MALKLNKKCIICGEQYRYCVNCRDSRPYEYWRNIYCSEECKSTGELWYAYRGKEISKKDAKQLMERRPDVLNKVFALDTPISKEIKDICDYSDVNIEEPIDKIGKSLNNEEVDVQETIEEKHDIAEVNADAEIVKVQSTPRKQAKPNYNRSKKNENKDQ